MLWPIQRYGVIIGWLAGPGWLAGQAVWPSGWRWRHHQMLKMANRGIPAAIKYQRIFIFGAGSISVSYQLSCSRWPLSAAAISGISAGQPAASIGGGGGPASSASSAGWPASAGESGWHQRGVAAPAASLASA